MSPPTPKSFRDNTFLESAKRTPRLSDSPLRLLQIVDKQLERQTEDLHKQIRELLQQSEARLLDQLEKRLCEKLTEMRMELDGVVERVTKLESELGASITSNNNKLSELKADIANVMNKAENTNTVSSDDIELKTEVNNLRFKIMQQENTAVACELRIDGIPYYDCENPYMIFCSICESLNIETPNVKAIYRLKTRSNIIAPTILVKLSSPYEKNYVLKSISNYRRRNKDLLRLFLLNFDSNAPFYINENLSQTNYKIFNKALKMKKDGTVFSVFTVRGIVHVMKGEMDKAVRIDLINELDELFRVNQIEK